SKTLLLAIAPRWARTNQYSLPSKPKVRGRRWFIFFTTCKHLMLSLFLRAQILPSIRVIQRKCVVNLKSPAGMHRRAQQNENHASNCRQSNAADRTGRRSVAQALGL